jgi:hypothetical protein
MIIERLSRVLGEMRMQQLEVEEHYPPEGVSFEEEVAQLDEFLGPANEFGAAYECIVANLEAAPFTLSSSAALALLEVGLLMRYKTDRKEDEVFDLRA